MGNENTREKKKRESLAKVESERIIVQNFEKRIRLQVESHLIEEINENSTLNLARITENFATFVNVGEYAGEDEVDYSVVYNYYFSGMKKLKIEKFSIRAKRVHMLVFVEESEIWAFFDNEHRICLYQNDRSIVIDMHHGFYFFKGMSSKGGALVYHSSDSSLKIIPKLKFSNLNNQEKIYEIEIPLESRLMGHQILENERIAVMSDTDFLGIFNYKGEIEKQLILNFRRISLASFTSCEKHFALSATGFNGKQVIQLFKNKKRRFQVTQTWDFDFESVIMDLKITKRLDGSVYVFANSCRYPYKIFILNQKGCIFSVDCQYRWSHSILLYWPLNQEEGVLVVGGESKKINVIRIKIAE